MAAGPNRARVELLDGDIRKTLISLTVPMALGKLGYAPGEVDEIVAYIDERNTIIGVPYVKAEHYPVFDCAIGERAIHYMGHVKISNTYWYLTGVPELMALAGARFERFAGAQHAGEFDDA